MIKDILETVQFIKETAATSHELGEVRDEVTQVRDEVTQVRSDLHDFKHTVDEKLTEVKSDIITHVDGIIILHQKLDTELAALRAKYERLESHVLLLAKHANIQLDF